MWQAPQAPACSFLRCATPWIASEETLRLAEPGGRAGRAGLCPGGIQATVLPLAWSAAPSLSTPPPRQGQIQYGIKSVYYCHPTFLTSVKCYGFKIFFQADKHWFDFVYSVFFAILKTEKQLLSTEDMLCFPMILVRRRCLVPMVGFFCSFSDMLF